MNIHPPKALTMAHVLYKDENPQINAELYVHFEDEEEARWVPIGMGNPTFFSDRGSEIPWNGDRTQVDYVKWVADEWIPRVPTTVHAIRVHFIGYDDFATVRMEQYLGKNEEGQMDSLVPSYWISNNTTYETLDV